MFQTGAKMVREYIDHALVVYARTPSRMYQ